MTDLTPPSDLAPTSPITSPKMGELTTSPTHPSPTEGGRGRDGALGEVDLAHELAQRLSLCHEHAGTVTTLAGHFGVTAPGRQRKELARIAEELARQHCRWFATRSTLPITRERPEA